MIRGAFVAGHRAEIERELAFFRKHRQRMRYHALKAEGVAIGSGVVEAANKTLVTQRMNRVTHGRTWPHRPHSTSIQTEGSNGVPP